jgi:hypothetical protein
MYISSNVKMVTLDLIKNELKDGKQKDYHPQCSDKRDVQNIFLPYIFQLLRKKDEKNKPS